MEQLGIREIQMAEYNILCRTVDVLEKYGLEYILCGGTMLGAVRHKGFIPWDDDIDIAIPRDDYEKFRSLVIDDRDIIKGMKVQLPGDDGHPYPFIKIVDETYTAEDNRFKKNFPVILWIDVFPLDHFPDDASEHAKCVKNLIALRNILYAGILHWDTYWKEIYEGDRLGRLKFLGKSAACSLLGGYKGIVNRIDQYAYSMDRKYQSSSHLGDGPWPNGIKDYFSTSSVRPFIKMQFEDREFNIPERYDAYLTQFYGDYMRIPPENERATHHITVYRTSDFRQE